MPNTLETMIDDAIIRGLTEARRTSLRTFLQTRYGSIPKTLEQRIGAADMEALYAMIACAAVAERIDDV
jgi:hypothetical protein